MAPSRWHGLVRAFVGGATLFVVATASLLAQRNMENLGRGVVAVRASSTQAFVSWRLLGLDPAGIGFNVYRSANGSAAVKLNSSVLTGGTNYTDSSANLAQPNAYHVRPVIGGVEQAPSGAFTLPANAPVEPVVRIPLSALPGSGYYTKFVWVGDLDGDGEYDYVIDRLAPFDPNNNDIGLGNQYLEGYRRNGQRLWQIDLGPNSRNTYNIEPGSSTLSMGMYDGATVYDLNSDGRAEVILKISNGVRFPNGSTFSNSDNNGQFLAILDGQTGNMLANAAFPTDFLADGSLGTQLGVGHVTGPSPSVILWGRNRVGSGGFNDVFAAYSWSGGSTVTQNWKRTIPSGTPGIAASHQMRIVDVTGDGLDEVATGNFMLNSNGTIRYQLAGVGHGDRFYITKMDAGRAGLQGYGIQQNHPDFLYEYYYDATTGAILWKHFGTSNADVGRGMVGDIDPRFAGYEVWSFYGLYNGRSNTLAEPNTGLRPWPSHALWWDGDVLNELLNDSKLEKWDPSNPTTTSTTPRILTLSTYGGTISGHHPMFLGDILGDWRTEIVCLNSSFTQLMIFTTNLATSTRIYTMPHNPAYRAHMTIKGYLQSPFVDYYLGNGMATPPVPNIRYSGGAAPSDGIANGTYKLQNRATGLMLDNLGALTDGASVGQWASGSSNNQRWVVSTAGSYRKLSCVTGGKFLDTLGNTADGSVIGQWASSSSGNQQWTFQATSGGYYRLVNRANGKCLDTGGQTTNGTFMQNWPVVNSPNQEWRFVAP